MEENADVAGIVMQNPHKPVIWAGASALRPAIDIAGRAAFAAPFSYEQGGLDVARKSRAIAPLAAAVLTLPTLAGCGSGGGNTVAGTGNGTSGTSSAQAAPPGQLFPDNFKGVCSGASVSAATAYVAGSKAHKALYFASYKDDFSDHSSSLPADWTVQYSQTGDAFKAIDLVVCAKRTAAHEVKVCDKYKTDGKPSQNKVRWHTATYALTAWEAKTGKKLAESSVEATDTDCPMFENFSSDSETVDDYASPSEAAVADFMRPHVTR